MRFYSLAKHQATEMANARKTSVWIAKAIKKESYKLEFTPVTSKNFSIIEEVTYQKNSNEQ